MLTLIRCTFHPVSPQVHVKDPGQSAKSAGGRLHLNRHTPLTQRSWSGPIMPLSGQSVGTLSGNELTRNSSGNTWSHSSQLAEPLWTNLGIKSGISVRELISTLKKKCRGERIVKHSPKILVSEEKAATTTTTYQSVNVICLKLYTFAALFELTILYHFQ